MELDDVDVLRAEAALLVDLRAAFFVMSKPTSLMQLFSSNVLGRSVAIAMPAISTAVFSSPCFFTKSSLARIAAPAPSLVGQHWSFVSGS